MLQTQSLGNFKIYTLAKQDSPSITWSSAFTDHMTENEISYPLHRTSSHRLTSCDNIHMLSHLSSYSFASHSHLYFLDSIVFWSYPAHPYRRFLVGRSGCRLSLSGVNRVSVLGCYLILPLQCSFRCIYVDKPSEVRLTTKVK